MLIAGVIEEGSYLTVTSHPDALAAISLCLDSPHIFALVRVPPTTLDRRPRQLFAKSVTRHQRQSDAVVFSFLGYWGMSDVLRGLIARRDQLTRRIAAALDAEKDVEGLVAANDRGESVIDLQLRLKSVGNQIDVYLGSQKRWERGA